DSPEFYAEYLMKNTKNDKVYSDKFAIHVLDLTQIETDKVKEDYPDLYYWAKLFVANTWEEIQMLSEKSEGIHEAVLTLRELSADEKIRMQCEAREMYEHDMASAIQNGETRGKLKGKTEVACNMLKKGYPISDICEITGLSEDDIHNLT
ncbi:MAG: Rpn family recombination-promoting nuclease/putative transposase, partial [Lachnospiraceae bacterium]|nr:Rpn family recombination-promoting nuclease/putative transposase [Lachnospiraceae bacterium]